MCLLKINGEISLNCHPELDSGSFFDDSESSSEWQLCLFFKWIL